MTFMMAVITGPSHGQSTKTRGAVLVRNPTVIVVIHRFHEDTHLLGLITNLDGVQVFNNSPISAWTQLAACSILPPDVRYGS